MKKFTRVLNIRTMNDFRGKRIVVCDFPSEFLFPPVGYGGIERWLWSVAKEADALGLEVIFSGPLWRKNLLAGVKYFEHRITKESVDIFKQRFGRVDFLVGGHEYFGNPIYDSFFKEISDIQFSFQHGTKPYSTIAYNADSTHLFCYSPQMMNLYREQSPHQTFCVSEGMNEDPIFSLDRKGYIVWMGRLDRDKAPHYAILAAKKLGMPIFLLGSTQYQPEYANKYEYLLSDPLVYRCGTVAGKKKMEIVSRAQCAIYTLDKGYIEAGVAVIGEFLRCGVAVAAMTWSGDDCAATAILDGQDGYIFKADLEMTEGQIVSGLAEKIIKSIDIPIENVYEYGRSVFDPKQLVLTWLKTAHRKSKDSLIL